MEQGHKLRTLLDCLQSLQILIFILQHQHKYFQRKSTHFNTDMVDTISEKLNKITPNKMIHKSLAIAVLGHGDKKVEVAGAVLLKVEERSVGEEVVD